MTKSGSWSGRNCPVATSSTTAMGKSKPPASFFRSAGARFRGEPSRAGVRHG
jgi:hypothetical protein